MLKKILKQFIPPVFFPKIFKEGINLIIREKNKFEYEKNFFSRHAFINRAIQKKGQQCNYLEIGVCKNEVFNSIPLSMKNKFGVDPNEGGTHRMTSDNFFKINKKKFDVIFIDGLHEYEQCKKDCLNSIKFLNKNGIILFHDFLPRNSFEEHVPRKQITWTGDVWKVAVELQNSQNCKFKIANIDMGVGILRPADNFKYKNLPELKKMKFKDFYEKYFKTYPLVSSEEALHFIDEN